MTNAEKFERGIPVPMSDKDWDEWHDLRQKKEEMGFASFMINNREEARAAISNVNGKNVISPDLFEQYKRKK